MSDELKWHQRLHFNCGSIATGNPAWDATAGTELASGSCNWDTAVRLIRELNGQDQTDVFLGFMGDESVHRQLSVSGGNADRYVVVVQEPERYCYLARCLKLNETRELVEVMIGGLPAFYPPALIHPLKTALCAAEHYFRTGRRTRKLSWMRGDVGERLRSRGEQVYHSTRSMGK